MFMLSIVIVKNTNINKNGLHLMTNMDEWMKIYNVKMNHSYVGWIDSNDYCPEFQWLPSHTHHLTFHNFWLTIYYVCRNFFFVVVVEIKTIIPSNTKQNKTSTGHSNANTQVLYIIICHIWWCWFDIFIIIIIINMMLPLSSLEIIFIFFLAQLSIVICLTGVHIHRLDRNQYFFFCHRHKPLSLI